jgi:DNA repair protein RadC
MPTSQSNLYTIKDMNEEERPRERLAKLGPQSLSTAELLAILLRVGTVGETSVQVGQRLLQTFGGITGLHRASFDELSGQKGVKLQAPFYRAGSPLCSISLNLLSTCSSHGSV